MANFIPKALIVLSLLLTSTTAHAVSETFCVSLDTQYTQTNGGEDHWRFNTTRRFRGIEVNVWDEWTTTLHTKYAEYDGPIKGCATFDLERTPRRGGNRYAVYVRSLASVSASMPGSARIVRMTVSRSDAGLGRNECITDNNAQLHCEKLVVLRTSHPVGSVGKTYPLVIPWDEELGMALVGTWMFTRSTWTLSPSETIHYQVGSGTGDLRGTDRIYGLTDEKFVIAHETGHVIQTLADGGREPGADYDGPNECNGVPQDPVSFRTHSLFSTEFDYSALVEGWAHFVAVATWNDTAQSDCIMFARAGGNFPMDYDMDGLTDSDQVSPARLSCEGKPWDLNHDGIYQPGTEGRQDWNGPAIGTLPPSHLTGRFWFGDMLVAGRCGPVLLARRNLGSEYDWTRFFWDMASDEGLTTVELTAMLVAANPSLMDRADGPRWRSNAPVKRMRSGAASLGLTAAFDRQVSNVDGL